MPNDSSGNDPRIIWQNQPTEPSVMTMERIRQKTQELRAKTRQKLLGGIAVTLLVVGISGYGVAAGDGPVRAVFALAIAWSIAGQYFLNRGMWAATLPQDAALSTGLESYRREVERRRYLFGRVLLWSFAPVILAIATLIALILSFGITNRGLSLQGTLLKMIPFLTLVVIWIVGVFVIRMREQRELRREIDQLNDIERENRR